MSWSEVIWLKKSAEKGKRLIASQGTIAKSFGGTRIDYTTLQPIGTFTPKYSGTVCIVSEIYAASSAGTKPYIVKVNDTTINYGTVQYPAQTAEHKFLYTNINVTAGQSYSISAYTGESGGGLSYYTIIGIGTILSESTLIQ